MSKLEIGAYFYPHIPNDPSRIARTKLNNTAAVNELQLAASAPRIFEGHNQPHKYNLGSAELNNWSDDNENTLTKHAELALEHGIDHFIFDTYIGERNGKIKQDSSGAIDTFAQSRNEAIQKMRFATMLCFRAPRVVLPVAPQFRENGRFLDPTPLGARGIVDISVRQYWNTKNYVHIDGRPYVSIFGSDIGKFGNQTREERLGQFVHELKEYSHRQYGIDPYVVGIIPNRNIENESVMYVSNGADALSGYGFLSLMDERETILQNHADLLPIRIADWQRVNDIAQVPFYPPIVLGWDASPRSDFYGQQEPFVLTSEQLKKFEKLYPHSPIVIGSTPELFDKSLNAGKDFLIRNNHGQHRRIVITAWNEITEGCALLPQTDNTGLVDYSYLRVLKSFRELNSDSS